MQFRQNSVFFSFSHLCMRPGQLLFVTLPDGQPETKAASKARHASGAAAPMVGRYEPVGHVLEALPSVR